MVKIPNIIGYPPDMGLPETNDKIKDSFPVASIRPGILDLTYGLPLVTVKDAWNAGTTGTPAYLDLLASHGYMFDDAGASNSVKLAYLADSFPSDSFTNDYGENFLQKFTDVASESMAAISQLMGQRNAFDAIKDLQTKLKSSDNKQAKQIGEMVDTAREVAENADASLRLIPSIANVAGSLAVGGRIDFPQLWKGSRFTPSYTMTVRLYNPDPGSLNSTERYIIGPITAILILGLPHSKEGGVFSWPYYHKIKSKGIFFLNPAFIGNITVIKGGDQQQIAFNKRLGIVDVRIDFGSLFSSMVVSSNSGGNLETRPTLRNYIHAMKGEDPVQERKKKIEDQLKASTSKAVSLYNNPTSRVSGVDRDASGKITNEGKDTTIL